MAREVKTDYTIRVIAKDGRVYEEDEVVVVPEEINLALIEALGL